MRFPDLVIMSINNLRRRNPCHCIRSLCLPGAYLFQIRGRREVLAEGLSERRSRIFCELVYDFIIF